MGALTNQLVYELGYDPDDPRENIPQVDEVARDLPVGAVVRARDGAVPVAVARLGSGRLVVVEDECPHDGGRISDGFVEGERLVCARHNWELEVVGRRCERVVNLRAACGGAARSGSPDLAVPASSGKSEGNLDPAR